MVSRFSYQMGLLGMLYDLTGSEKVNTVASKPEKPTTQLVVLIETKSQRFYICASEVQISYGTIKYVVRRYDLTGSWKSRYCILILYSGSVVFVWRVSS